jgi:hypothetical protein
VNPLAPCKMIVPGRQPQHGSMVQKGPPYWSYAPKGAERPARRQCAAPEPEKKGRWLSRKSFRFKGPYSALLIFWYEGSRHMPGSAWAVKFSGLIAA